MKKRNKILLVIIGVITATLLITNPSLNSFETYLEAHSISTKSTPVRQYKDDLHNQTFVNGTNFTFGRKSNYFIFSIYKYNQNKFRITGTKYDYISSEYFGIFGNFYLID